MSEKSNPNLLRGFATGGFATGSISAQLFCTELFFGTKLLFGIKSGRNWATTVMLFFTLIANECPAAVQDITITDVTTRAFSVVWSSDEAIVSASVNVFTDQGGSQDITSTLKVTLESSNFPPALTNGIAKVTVSGLNPNTTYYIQTITVSNSATFMEPPAAPFLDLTTAVSTRQVNVGNQLIVNDLIAHPMFAPDGVSPAAGTLLLLEADGLSRYPLSVFVGEGGVGDALALIDLSNLFDQTGENAELAAGQVLRLTALRGNSFCPGLLDHRQVRFRKSPIHEETPVIAEVETAPNCYFADTVCDNQIDVLDAQYVVNSLNSAPGNCKYNVDLDVVADGVIDIIDAMQVLNYLGTPVP